MAKKSKIPKIDEKMSLAEAFGAGAQVSAPVNAAPDARQSEPKPKSEPERDVREPAQEAPEVYLPDDYDDELDMLEDELNLTRKELARMEEENRSLKGQIRIYAQKEREVKDIIEDAERTRAAAVRTNELLQENYVLGKEKETLNASLARAHTRINELEDELAQIAQKDEITGEVLRSFERLQLLEREKEDLRREVENREQKYDELGIKLGERKRELADIYRRKKKEEDRGKDYSDLQREYDKLSDLVDTLMLRLADYEMMPDEDEEARLRSARIVIITDYLPSTKSMETIFHKEGFDMNNIEIVDDYGKLTNRNLNFLRNERYSAVLVGPVPHSMRGMGDATSIIAMLREPGYPFVVELRDRSGRLNTTQDSLKRAARTVREYLVEY